MKIATTLVLVALAWTMNGCSSAPSPETGDKPGGPGAPVKQSVHGTADDTFTLNPESVILRQGERKTVKVAIDRNVNFDQDVTLGFGALPKGLSVDDSSPIIKKNETVGHFALTAAADAAVGSFSIRITGHPAKGADASNDLNITVERSAP